MARTASFNADSYPAVPNNHRERTPENIHTRIANPLNTPAVNQNAVEA